MKGKIVSYLFKKYMQPELVDFKNKGGLIYSSNLDYFLKGFWFEGSAFSASSFTIVVFIQPLYIPDDDITFVISRRLGDLREKRDIWWDYFPYSEAELLKDLLNRMKKEGLRYLNQFNSPADYVRAYHKEYARLNNHLMIESYIYSLILIGNFNEAIKGTQPFYNHLVSKCTEYPFYSEVIKRLARLMSYLDKGDFEMARSLVLSYREGTIKALGLTP